MTKEKILIATGGTGGHVFPAYSLANFLIENNYSVKLTTDKRGFKYLKDYDKLNLVKIPSSPLIKKNIFKYLSSIFVIIYSIIRSTFFLLMNKPAIVIGMGGYSSFPICIAAFILRIKFIIYENNLIIGRANKYLLPFATKVLVSYDNVNGIKKKYEKKIFKIGNIIKKEIINFYDKKIENNKSKNLSILVLGGSQAAKVFAEILPGIFQKCVDKEIPLKIYQHCLSEQNENLRLFYQKNKIEFETFNFSHNLIDYFSKVNLAITRSGSSILAELTNAKIPFISIPLPSSVDNHQFENALYYSKKKFGFLIEEKNLELNLAQLIDELYKSNTLLDSIKKNQKQYSDKNVYNNIDQVLKKIIDEKN